MREEKKGRKDRKTKERKKERKKERHEKRKERQKKTQMNAGSEKTHLIVLLRTGHKRVNTHMYSKLSIGQTDRYPCDSA